MQLTRLKPALGMPPPLCHLAGSADAEVLRCVAVADGVTPAPCDNSLWVLGPVTWGHYRLRVEGRPRGRRTTCWRHEQEIFVGAGDNPPQTLYIPPLLSPVDRESRCP